MLSSKLLHMRGLVFCALSLPRHSHTQGPLGMSQPSACPLATTLTVMSWWLMRSWNEKVNARIDQANQLSELMQQHRKWTPGDS